MQRVEGTETTIEVFENDIDFFLHQFTEEQNIEDLRTVPQSVWNGALTYINRHVFKPNPHLLKQRTNISVSGNDIPSNYNAYNYNIINNILDYYIYLCQIYNKECSIVGFSNLTGINTDTIIDWGNNSTKLSTSSCDIHKRLIVAREESLSNKLADGKQNPVGVIAMLNRHYGWASPYTADANRNKQALTANQLPRLDQNPQIVHTIETQNDGQTD